MNRKLLAAGAVALAMAASQSIKAETVYQMTGDVTDGIDLVGGGYATDRLYGPTAAAASLGGTVTHDATLTKENPFKIFGFGQTLKFTSDTSLFDVPVRLSAGDGVTASTCYQFRYSGMIRGGLEVLRPGKIEVYNQLTFAGTTNDDTSVACDVVLNGVQADVASTTIFGTVDGDANLYLSNATYKVVSGSFQLGKMSAPNRYGMRVSMDLYNSTFEDSIGEITLMEGVRGENTENCFITVGPVSTLKARRIRHSGGDYSRVKFNGGRYVVADGNSEVFNVAGYSYNGGWPSPHITVEGVDGNPIDIEINADHNLASGSNNRKVDFTGNGGFVKRGAGILSWTRPGCDYPWDSSIVSLCNYTGDTVVKGGGIKQILSAYLPGRGALVLEAEGTTYDLNGISNKLFTAATGLGSVVNTSVTNATLALGYNNASGEWNVSVADTIPVEKIGTGTLTIGVNAADYAGDFTILAGTAKLATGVAMKKLGTVTVAAGATLDIRGASLKCTKLVNNGKVLSDEDSSLTINLENDEELNFGIAGAVEKTGAGAMTIGSGLDCVTDLKVTAGTLHCSVAAFSGKYFKLQYVGGINGSSGISLGEFSLYDSAGRRVNEGTYTYNEIVTNGEQKNGLNTLEGIAECEVALMGAGGGYFHMHKDGEDPAKLLDGDAASACILRYSWGNSAIGFRLPDAAKAVVGYSLTVPNNYSSDSILNKWKVFGSHDGVNWTLLDDRSAEQTVPASTEKGVEYNGGVPYALSAGTDTTGALLASGGIVTVAAGATLDPAVLGLGIEKLAIDYAAGAGTITRCTAMANGAVYITISEGAKLRLPCTLPLTIDELGNAAALKTWTVYVNGETLEKARLSYNGNQLQLSGAGFVFSIR